MPPKRATAAATRGGTAPAAATSKASAKANTSSKRKSTEEQDDQPERRSKRARTQPAVLADEQAESKERVANKGVKKATATQKKTTTSRKNSTTKKDTSKVASKTDSKPRTKRARSTKKDAAAEETSASEVEEPVKKAAKPAGRPKATPKTRAPAKPKKELPILNHPPTQRLDVLVCGEGENGELGLGSAKGQSGVKRPRLNPLLAAKTIGVVQVACGGMHNLALTHDNRILTWGINDQGTLGRDTTWDGGLRDIDAGSSSDSEDEGSSLNPRESTPTAIDSANFPDGTRFAQVAAGDSCSFALTTTGLVYGWGTFRANEGILGFNADTIVQRTPTLLSDLKNITSIACGANHVLALDKDGNVFAWGSGQQMQLGRKPVERTRASGLTPRPLGLPKKQIIRVACGAYHAFALDKKDNVWAWGLNNFGECGLEQDAGQSEATVPKPTKVPELSGKGVTSIKGGEHHSAAVDGAGNCLVWGRADGAQLGLDISVLDDNQVIKDENGRTRIVIAPTIVPEIAGRTKMVTAAGDHTLAVTNDGQAWSWGFSALYQTGQGSSEDVERATRIENTATRERQISWAGAGGQYSVLAAPATLDGDGDVVMN